jgi:CBS domain-containing protein
MRTVKEILQEKGAEIVTVEESQTVFKALEKMAEMNIGAVVVTDAAGGIAGIFSERDFSRKAVINRSAPVDVSVQEFMTAVVHTVEPSHSVDQCMAVVTDKRCRHLPVMENGVLCGLVSIGDLVKASLAEKEFLIKQLTEYIQYP